MPPIAGPSARVAVAAGLGVGGDYFDALTFADGAIAICIADVAGKGLPAALLMSNLQAAVARVRQERARPPDRSARASTAALP